MQFVFFGLEVQATENGPDSYTVWQPTPVPPGFAGLRPRDFKTRTEAIAFIEEIHIPGRRSQGWLLLEGW
jgi:hypothetical protein